ncbi:hypothetical protein CPB97_010464 [Podila verticillata]|nr:hypothetical protein CPB97_010464 [Podila verticillata]
MGIPIPYNSQDEDPSPKVCTTLDCRCADCRPARLIRIGTAVNQDRLRHHRIHPNEGTEINTRLPSGHIFRHPSNSQQVHWSLQNEPYWHFLSRTSDPMDRSRATNSTQTPSSPHPARLASMTAPSTHRMPSSLLSPLLDEVTGLSLNHSSPQSPPVGLRTQEWAMRMEGVDYYHESDGEPMVQEEDEGGEVARQSIPGYSRFYPHMTERAQGGGGGGGVNGRQDAATSRGLRRPIGYVDIDSMF